MNTSANAPAAEFDYIVIGAGSSGCAVAGRLAQDPAVSVALIENGPADHHFSVWAPLGVAKTVIKASPYNYGFYSQPQAGLNGRSSYQPRGRGLGGSSSINGMIYVRGHRNDYDRWARMGCTGWGFNDVLPYFRRGEQNLRCVGRDDDLFHGGTGPLHVCDVRDPNPFSQRFIQAAHQAGLPFNDDFNGAQQDGVGMYQVTLRKGERWNAARAYLHQGNADDPGFNGGRKNLTVMLQTQALRIEFEGQRACGVRVLREGGVEQVLRARREVIVSGGAFHSPQLLMASGIGPGAHLREHGIDVLHDLPGVGQNLQDHIDVTIQKRVKSTDLFGFSAAGVLRMIKEIMRYRRERRGMVACNIIESGGFLRTQPGLSEPDMQLAFVLALLGERNQGDRTDLKKKAHGYTLHATVLRPKSRGHVRLQSADMRADPLIDMGFLSAEEDMEGLITGVKLMRKIFAQPALAEMGGQEVGTEAFGANNENEQAIREFIRGQADSLFHPIGTCKMGVDDMAVVDPALRVRGVEGLRVVDCSIMPDLIGGNTNAPAMMIGEKAADLIRTAQ